MNLAMEYASPERYERHVKGCGETKYYAATLYFHDEAEREAVISAMGW